MTIAVADLFQHPDTGRMLSRGEEFDGDEAARIMADPERASRCVVIAPDAPAPAAIAPPAVTVPAEPEPQAASEPASSRAKSLTDTKE